MKRPPPPRPLAPAHPPRPGVRVSRPWQRPLTFRPFAAALRQFRVGRR